VSVVDVGEAVESVSRMHTTAEGVVRDAELGRVTPEAIRAVSVVVVHGRPPRFAELARRSSRI
jgi:hypothetical protein